MSNSTTSPDSFGARGDLQVGDASYEIFRIGALADRFDVARLPYSIKVILENLLRHEDGLAVTASDIEAVAGWGVDPERHGVGGSDAAEIALTPERVLMQDLTGVPGVVDLAAMRTAMVALGGDPKKINPLIPVDLVIDHSVQVDEYGTDQALLDNMALPMLAQGVALVAGRAITEASGRISPDTVAAIAATGVDLISVGWLTHSAAVLDIGLDYRMSQSF